MLMAIIVVVPEAATKLYIMFKRTQPQTTIKSIKRKRKSEQILQICQPCCFCDYFSISNHLNIIKRSYQALRGLF